jgi:hypothetical protein
MIEAERDDYMMRMSPESEFIWLAFMARFLSSIIFFLKKRRKMLFQNWAEEADLRIRIKGRARSGDSNRAIQ